SAAVIAAFLAFGLAAKEEASCQENRRDEGIRQPEAQIAMVHGQRRVQEPNRGTEIPDPIEIPAHLTMGCGAWCGRYLFDLMAKRLFGRHREGWVCSEGAIPVRPVASRYE
ncbi:MAG: hypothetical protein WBD93_02865, partial [Acidobacteriaceae bacterium]